MLLMTAFQLISAACVLCRQEELSLSLVYIFFGYIAAEWIYMLIGTLVTGNDYFELEAIAFFLSGIGLTVCASFSETYALKQGHRHCDGSRRLSDNDGRSSGMCGSPAGCVTPLR